MLSIRTIFTIAVLNVFIIQAGGPKAEGSVEPGLINYALARLLHPKVKVVGKKEMKEYAHLFKVIAEIEFENLQGKGSRRFPVNFEEEVKMGVFHVEETIPFSDPSKTILKKYRDEMGWSFFTDARKNKHILDDRAQEFATKHIGSAFNNFTDINWQEINNNNIYRAARHVKIALALIASGVVGSALCALVVKTIKARKRT